MWIALFAIAIATALGLGIAAFAMQPAARHYWWSMIFSENRYPPRIKSGAGFFGIML
jgi:hypothetical protein